MEIPIICRILNNNINRNILEVGNTLSHYFPVNHTILDKYEKADGVVNQDVVDFQQSKKYDLIVSISTLEHVGWDEEPRDPAKIMRAFENLKNLLVSGGKIVVTLPLGENNEMDKRLIEGKIQFTEQYCMKRISKDNKWIEVNWNDMCKGKDDSFFIAGNGLVIGIIEEK